MSNYFPFAFQRDPANPGADRILQMIEQRMDWLNRCHAKSGLEGHIFAAALCSYASKIPAKVVKASQRENVWEFLKMAFTENDIARLTVCLKDAFSDTPERIEFPNAIALVDCRFVTNSEWEFLRRYSIGGSDAAGIMGKSHYASPLKLYYDKLGKIPKVTDYDKQFIFDFGHNVEDFIIEKSCALLGCVHYPEYRMWRHREYSYITSNPDGILMFPDGQLALFEAKTATRFKKDDWAEGIPDYYSPQPQQYLEVLNDARLTKGYIGAVFGGLPSDFKAHMYNRERDTAQNQVDQIKLFWNGNLITGIAPELTGKEKLDQDAVYCYKSNTHFQVSEQALSDTTVDDFRDYFELDKKRTSLNKQVRKLKEQEDAILADITSKYPVDIPLVFTKQGGMSYLLRKKGTGGETVDLDRIPVAQINRILSDIKKATAPSQVFSSPVVKKSRKSQKGTK